MPTSRVTAESVVRAGASADRNSATVLVLATHQKSGLAVVRTLGRQGYEVVAASHKPVAQGRCSRYATETWTYSDPENGRQFASDIAEAILAHDVDVVFPTDHYTTLSVSQFRDEFRPRAAVPVVDYETLTEAEDKERLLAVADDLDISIPETYRPKSAEEVATVATEISYPAVVKAVRSVGAYGVQYVDTPEQLREVCTRDGTSTIHFETTRPLVQEFVPGDIHDANVLFDHGEPVATFTSTRVSTFPPSGGRSVVSQSTHEPELAELATRLMERLDWHGVAEAEFKLDSRDSRPKLLEVNPRIWGNVGLSISSGVDFPTLLCDLALGRPVSPPPNYRVGRKRVWFEGGFGNHLFKRDDRFGYLRHIGRQFLDDTDSNVAITDPVPHAVRVAQLSWDAVKSVYPQ